MSDRYHASSVPVSFGDYAAGQSLTWRVVDSETDKDTGKRFPTIQDARAEADRLNTESEGV